MKSISCIMQAIDLAMFGGTKTPHGISHPVIRLCDGEYRLAVFGYHKSREDAKNGVLRRPCRWLVADLAEGTVESLNLCTETDFSDAPQDATYDVTRYEGEKPQRADIDRLYAMLEELRASILRGAEELPAQVERYHAELFRMMPTDYARFYRDLAR